MVGHLYRSVNQSQANKPPRRQQTPAGRATLRERTKVEHALAHVGHWQGRRAPATAATARICSTTRGASVVYNLHVIAR